MIPYLKSTAALAAILISAWSIGCSGSSSSKPVTLSSNPMSSSSRMAKLAQKSQAEAGKSSEEKDEAVALSALPQAVIDAVNKAVPGGTLLSAALEDENGHMAYGIAVRTEAGKVLEFKVDQKGGVKKEDDRDAGNETSRY